MLVAQAEIDLILNPRMRRRMMRLPVASEHCPVERGKPYRLQSRPFTPSQVTITVTETRREPLAALSVSLADAKREGYGSTQGALEAWRRINGRPGRKQEVWVVAFCKGDESEFTDQDKPVFLRRTGGYTTVADELQAGEVMVLPGAAERARIMDLARRHAPARTAISNAIAEVETLHGQMASMKARNRAKLIQKELRRLQAEQPVAEVARTA